MSSPKPRVALVTGASSGIGRAIAIALGRLGWRVAVGARRADALAATAQLVEDVGGHALAHPLDVTDAESIDRWFDTAEATLGPVDALINNAGTATPGALDELSASAITGEVAANLTGPMLLARRAIASLRARDAAGDLVFISSDAARQARPKMAPYSATKAGLEMLARSLSMELEGTGIRSTTIRVGPTASEFGTTWDWDEVKELMTYWPRFGLQRHLATLAPETVAEAVVLALTLPRGAHLDLLELQPEAPRE